MAYRFTLPLLLCLFSVVGLRAQSIDLNVGKTQSSAYFETVSFEVHHNGLLIVPVEIGGKTYRFLFDTGAPNIISKELNELLNPPVLQTANTTDASGKKNELSVVSVESLSLGGVTFENTATLVYDLRGSQLFKCFDIDGFIGSNMLRNSVVQINRKNKTITLTNSPRKLQLKRKNAEKLRLKSNQSTPYCWISLKGEKNAREAVLIDTGDDGLYDLGKSHYNMLQEYSIFKELSKSSGAASMGLFGEVEQEEQLLLLVPELHFNGLELQNVVTATGKDDDSRIGVEILDYGVMTLDYKRKRFYFDPYERVVDVTKAEYGFSRTLKGGQLVVGFVWDEALQSQMSYGDEILEIDGISFEISKLCDLVNGKFGLQEKSSITLKIKSATSGEIREVRVEKKLPADLAKP